MSVRRYFTVRKTTDLNTYQNVKKEISVVQSVRQQTNIKLSAIYRRRSSALSLSPVLLVARSTTGLSPASHARGPSSKNFTPLRDITFHQVQTVRRRLYSSTKGYNLSYAHKAMKFYRLFTRRKKAHVLSYTRTARLRLQRMKLSHVGHKDSYRRRASRLKLHSWERRRNYGALSAFGTRALRSATLFWSRTARNVAAGARKRTVLVSTVVPPYASTRKFRYGKFVGATAACAVRRTGQFYHLLGRRRMQKIARQHAYSARKHPLRTKARKALRARRAAKLASGCRHQTWWIRHRPTKRHAKSLHPITWRKLRRQTFLLAHSAYRQQKIFLRQFKNRRRYLVSVPATPRVRAQRLTVFRRLRVRQTRTFTYAYAQSAQRTFHAQATPTAYSLAQFTAYANSQLPVDMTLSLALAHTKFRQYLSLVAKKALLASMKPAAKRARMLRLSRRSRRVCFTKSKALVKNFSSSLRKKFFAIHRSAVRCVKQKTNKSFGVIENFLHRYSKAQQILSPSAPHGSFFLLASRRPQCLIAPAPSTVHWRRSYQLTSALRAYFARAGRLQARGSVLGKSTQAEKRYRLWRKIVFPGSGNLSARRVISVARSRFNRPKISYWLRRRLQHLTRCRRRGYGQKMWRLRAGNRRLKNKFKFNFKRPPHTRKLLSFPLHKQNVALGRLKFNGKHRLNMMLRLRFLKARHLFAIHRRQKSFDRNKFSYRTRTIFVSPTARTSRPRFFTNRWTSRSCVTAALSRTTVVHSAARTLSNVNKLPLGLQLFYARLSAFDTLRTDRTISFFSGT